MEPNTGCPAASFCFIVFSRIVLCSYPAGSADTFDGMLCAVVSAVNIP